MVVHRLAANVDKATSQQVPAPGRVGFVVSKSVGPAVTRNRVKRRLRHLMRDRVSTLSDGSMLVVRAQPEAAQASYRDLGEELDRCLTRVVGS